MSTDPEDDFLNGAVGDGLMAAGLIAGVACAVLVHLARVARHLLHRGR